MENKNHIAEAPESETKSAWRRLASPLVTFFIIIVIIATKNDLEKRGEALGLGSFAGVITVMDMYGRSLLLNLIQPSGSETRKVAVVDISGMYETFREGDTPTNKQLRGDDNSQEKSYFDEPHPPLKIFTRRDDLWNVIRAVARHYPTAIGVDVDMAPNDDAKMEPIGTYEFLEKAYEASNGGYQNFDASGNPEEITNVPIVLGIFRRRSLSEKEWLGSIRYGSLAGSMDLGWPKGKFPDQTRIPLWFKSHAPTFRLPSLSGRLAGSLAEIDFDPPENWFSESLRIQHVRDKRELEVATFTLNTGLIDLVETEVIHGFNTSYIDRDENIAKITGRVVLIGAMHEDTRTILGVRDTPVPGVLVHACAVQTLTEGYISQPTDNGRKALDFAVSILLLVIVTLYCFFRGQTEHFHTVHILMTWIFVLIIIIGAYYLASVQKFLWTDFWVVALGMLLHSPIQHTIEEIAIKPFLLGCKMLYSLCFRWMGRGVTGSTANR